MGSLLICNRNNRLLLSDTLNWNLNTLVYDLAFDLNMCYNAYGEPLGAVGL